MTTPSDPPPDAPHGQSPPEGVNLGKDEPRPAAPAAGEPSAPGPGDAPFDPYRYGRPDHPIPAEYAPPGYTGPTAPPARPYGPPSGKPYGGEPGNPYGGERGNPYGGEPSSPYARESYGAGSPYANPPGAPYGEQHPSPYGYGAPPPPAYHAYIQPRRGNGRAVAALVLGVLSILFCWLFVFDAVFVVLALVFGLIALGDARKGRAGGRGMAVAGLVCTLIGAILATIISVKAFHAIDKCGGFNHTSGSSFNQCFRDNF